MKAIRVRQFGPPEVMVLEEVADPVPAAGQVVIRVLAAGANPLDTYLRAGMKIGDYSPVLPWTPGNDAAGVVESVGAGVFSVKPGDRVYAQPLTGAYAERALCQASQVYPLPDNVTFPEATCINVPCRTAYYALFELGRAQSGQVVFVHGASGSVGNAAVQLAADAGLTVIGTAGTDEGSSLVKKLGAHHVFNHRQSDYLEKIRAAAGGVDLILEMAASANLNHDIGLIKPGGRIIVIGGGRPVEIDPVGIIGAGVNIIGVRLSLIGAELNQKIHSELRQRLSEGKLKPVVDEEIPLAEAARAHHAVSQSGSLGKICLIP
jgi:NADPH2:quinone reductase